MAKYELSLIKDYVPTWGVREAVREIFQNAFDQEILNPEAKAHWDYDAYSETLSVYSDNTSLNPSTLLFGSTSKADKSNTVGQFGEGYKLAALVLTRLGKKFTIYNTQTAETWTCRFVKSRRYNAEVLTFEISRPLPGLGVRGKHLCVLVEGITKEEWTDVIVPSNLRLQPELKPIHSSYSGEIYEAPGAVYVNGMLICEYAPYSYAYNFKPNVLKLDRDRKLASDFDLAWAASRVWREAMHTDSSVMSSIIALLNKGAADVKYVYNLSDRGWQPNPDTILHNTVYQHFVSAYGEDAIPVVYQHEADKIPTQFKPIIVPEAVYLHINTATEFVSVREALAQAIAEQSLDEEDDVEPVELLSNWFNEYRYLLSTIAIDEFEVILKRMSLTK